MPFSPDGACIPSWVGVAPVASLGDVAQAMNFNNYALKVGYVVAVHEPDPKHPETMYDVVTRTGLGDQAATWQLYTNLRVSAGLGGTAEEYTRVRLRAPRAKYDHKEGLTADQLREATCVVFTCEQGFSHLGYIVGFGEHPNLVADDMDLGHYYKWAFNGITSIVNSDGEYSVEFTGAILDPNTNFHVAPPEPTTGTFFKFSKDGGWLVDDVKGESITLDKPNATLDMVARNMDITITEHNLNGTAKEKVHFVAGTNAIFNGGKVYIGKEGAGDPLVLGNHLADALDKLVRILTENPIVGRAGKIPVMLFEPVKTQLQMWRKLYGKKNTSPFLSRKGYVE